MNIRERKETIDSHIDISSLLGKKNIKDKVEDVDKYWNSLMRPPIRTYLPDWVIQRLWDHAKSPRLMNNPMKKFKLNNELLEPFGFKPLASGTNRRAFYAEFDPGIVLKIGSDDVGINDNNDEYLYTQHMLKPFCPKVFGVDGMGVVALQERGEPMTERDYKLVWAEEIFDLLFILLNRGFIMEDVGSNFHKNFGIRMGFGPIIWDFPYVYRVDPHKLICNKPHPITGEPCGGELDYFYAGGMNEIRCQKCQTRYSAKYLADNTKLESIVTGVGGRNMRSFVNNIKVRIMQGDRMVSGGTKETKTVLNGSPETIQSVNGLNMTPAMRQAVTEAQVDMGYKAEMQGQNPYKIPKTPILPEKPKEVGKLVSEAKDFDPSKKTTKEVKVPANERVKTMIQNGETDAFAIASEFLRGDHVTPEMFKTLENMKPQVPDTPEDVTPRDTIGPIKQFTHFYKNGKRQFYYGTPLKRLLISVLDRIEREFGLDTANIVADKLELGYMSRDLFINSGMATEKYKEAYAKYNKETKKEESNVEVTETGAKIIHKRSIVQAKSPYETVNTLNRADAVDTIIPPPKKNEATKDAGKWDSKRERITSETPKDKEVTQKPEKSEPPVQTEGLFPMKPKTVEEIEAEEAKKSEETAVMGFPGVALTETIRFKTEAPKLKETVEKRFNGFPMGSNEADEMVKKLEKDVYEFVLEDVANIMNTDQKGLEVNVTRTRDNRNADCFEVRVLNYNSPVFNTLLYPDNKTVDEELTKEMEEEPVVEEDINRQVYDFFTKMTSEFKGTGSVGTIKEELKSHLFSKAIDSFESKGVAPAKLYKMADEYVETKVKFVQSEKKETTAPPPQAPEIKEGSVGANL